MNRESAPRPRPLRRAVLRSAALCGLLLLVAAGPLAAQATTQEPASPGPPPAAPQTPTAAFPKGEIVDPVTTLADSEETYALYLPSNYTSERRRPVLLVFDPRSRGKAAADLFRAAAETYGWVVVSSNNTASDGPMEPNTRAVNALLSEVEHRFASDLQRVYLAGFSGTARVAWAVALGLPHAVAGVIVASGGFPPAAPPTADLPFAVFGTAGTTDFNYQEMQTVADRLEALGRPYRNEVFDGPHSWPPAELCAEAVAWMELQAMKTGRAPRDEAVIDRLLADWLGAARSLAAAGKPVEAWHRFDEVARDFAGLRDVAEAREEAERLKASAAVADHLAQRGQAAAWEEGRRREVGEIVGPLQARGSIPGPQLKARGEELIHKLQRTAADGPESEQGLAARRVLAMFGSFLSFYLPRDFLARGDYARAIMPLELAVEIRDDNPTAWYNLACAHARGGSKKRALEALERAVRAGFTDRAHIESDDDLASLRREKRYQEIVGGLPAKGEPAADSE